MQTTHGLDIAAFGEGVAKSISELLDEVQKGESTLRVVDGRALRIVRVLNLLVCNSKGEVSTKWKAEAFLRMDELKLAFLTATVLLRISNGCGHPLIVGCLKLTDRCCCCGGFQESSRIP